MEKPDTSWRSSLRSRGGARRRRRAAILVVVGLASAVVAWSLFLVFPERAVPQPADAIVMLAGADDGRHAYAVNLADAGLAPTLVVSNPLGRGEPVAWSTCHGTRRPAKARTWCLPPNPVNTAGEAVTVQQLADEQGWESVIVVTNRPHTTRARWTFEHCTHLDVQMAPINHVDAIRLPVHVAIEAAGFVRNSLRGCPA